MTTYDAATGAPINSPNSPTAPAGNGVLFTKATTIQSPFLWFAGGMIAMVAIYYIFNSDKFKTKLF